VAHLTRAFFSASRNAACSPKVDQPLTVNSSVAASGSLGQGEPFASSGATVFLSFTTTVILQTRKPSDRSMNRKASTPAAVTPPAAAVPPPAAASSSTSRRIRWNSSVMTGS